jgi:DNA mismatch endonuclease Vsr
MADASPNQRGGFITKQPVATTCRRSAATNTKPEILVRKFLHAQSYRYTLHNKTLPGKPDIVLHKYKTEIFVHGCFWHGHNKCKYFVVSKTRSRLHRCNKSGKFEIMQDKVIHIDPEILGGTPVFYGTRVPIKNLFDYLETGETIETFLQDFDSVSREQVLKVLELSEQLIQSSSSILHENIT